MEKIAIIIPSRLDSVRLPNKPLKLINNKEMILHVYNVAKSSNVGEVIVATPDKEILDLIKTHNGQAILTSDKHQTGTDRVFEVFERVLESKPEVIINFQGDMPNLNPNAINLLEDKIHFPELSINPNAIQLNIKFQSPAPLPTKT